MARAAALFSAISSRRAALDREERSRGGAQDGEVLLDDRRERARPADDGDGDDDDNGALYTNGSLPPITRLSAKTKEEKRAKGPIEKL